MAEKSPFKVLATNRRARHDYFIEEKLEAGIVLTGTEVKSLRQGRANLKESHAAVRRREIWLVNCHISPYSHGNLSNHEPLRERKLLLHRIEILKLERKKKLAGLTLIPLRFYLKRGKIKLELAVAKGKKLHDKREAIKRKDLDREARRR